MRDHVSIHIRGLEAGLTVLAEKETGFAGTAYQSSGWLASSGSALANGRIPVIVEGQVGTKTVFLLPMMTWTFAGSVICGWLDYENNLSGGLFDPSWLAAAQPSDATNILRQITRVKPSIDAFHLSKQRLTIDGLPNPFASIGVASQHADPLFEACMADSFEEWERQRRSRHSRNRLRSATKKLTAAHGEICVKRAMDDVELEDSLEAFFSQRARTQANGRIPNPFSDATRHAFVWENAKASLSTPEGFAVFSLRAGGQICAVCMGLRRGKHYTGFANSIDESLSFFSPGKVLDREVLKLLHEDGVRHIDLGLGEASYKTAWADRQFLTDNAMPVSAKGQATSLALRSLGQAKSFIKSDRRLVSLTKKLRIRQFQKAA